MPNEYLQRRYLLSFESRRLPHIFTDVLVIGCGAAGLRAAIEAAQYGEVIILSKGKMIDSNTYYAQGGLAAVMDADDTQEAHMADTLATAKGLGDEAVIREVVSGAPEHIRQLQEWGVGFDLEDGHLQLGREGGHNASRIVHALGDATGKVMVEALTAHAKGISRIKFFEECFVIDLLTDPPEGGQEARCVGVLTYHPRYGLQMIWAKQTILAAGGAGILWRETSNPPNATADSIAIALRAGVQLADLEMMQFHPTVLYVAGASRSLISEAVRGEGAYLLDRRGQRFMHQYHEMGELAPRDEVSRAILHRMSETRSTHVYLDVRHLGAEVFAARFPQIDRQCRSFGIDPGRDLIPVHPAAHYMIGGANVDLDGRTNLIGLWACGEASSTGLHGANRLASNSLTEALVFGKRCGELAGQSLNGTESLWRPIDGSFDRCEKSDLDLSDICNSLRSQMWRNVGIVRNGDALQETLDLIDFWGRYTMNKEFFGPAGWQVQNMLSAAYVVTFCALQRTETRGVHYREDYPETDPAWQHRQFLRRVPGELIVE